MAKIWSLAYDLHLNVLVVPVTLFPAPAACSEGMLRMFGPIWGNLVPVALLGSLLSFTAISILYALAYRWFAVTGKAEIMTSRKGIVVMSVLLLFYCTPVYVAETFVFDIDEEAATANVLQAYPELASVFNHRKSCVAVPVRSNVAMYSFAAIVAIQVGAITLAALVCVTKILVLLERRRLQMSSRTYRMHRQLTVALALQFVMPLGTLGIPLILEISLGIFQVDMRGKIGLTTVERGPRDAMK
ncbi:hypothetical protein AAVH_05924 [Aphelenchoides avenae]|nr:hypothetical protein AAVH_05924 [Aphelenchus avenae]